MTATETVEAADTAGTAGTAREIVGEQIVKGVSCPRDSLSGLHRVVWAAHGRALRSAASHLGEMNARIHVSNSRDDDCAPTHVDARGLMDKRTL